MKKYDFWRKNQLQQYYLMITVFNNIKGLKGLCQCFLCYFYKEGIKNEPATKAQLLNAGSFIRPYGELAEKLKFFTFVKRVVYWQPQQNSRRPRRQVLKVPPV